MSHTPTLVQLLDEIHDLEKGVKINELHTNETMPLYITFPGQKCLNGSLL